MNPEGRADAPTQALGPRFPRRVRDLISWVVPKLGYRLISVLASNEARPDEGPPYLPFLSHPRLMSMGLAPLSSGHWIEPAADLPWYYSNKLRQRGEFGSRVYQALPESIAAQRELSRVLLNHLLGDHADSYRLRNGRLEAPDAGLEWDIAGDESLWLASLWVADDICILQAGPTSGHRLTAASLCAPSYWLLEEKIGCTLDQIHRAVPGYAGKLSARVEQLLARLDCSLAFWRANWSIVDSPELLQRARAGVSSAAKRPLYLRVERQTLCRLPETRAIVFTIKVHINPLVQVAAVAEWRAGLLRAIALLSEQELSYKGLDTLLPFIHQVLGR